MHWFDKHEIILLRKYLCQICQMQSYRWILQKVLDCVSRRPKPVFVGSEMNKNITLTVLKFMYLMVIFPAIVSSTLKGKRFLSSPCWHGSRGYNDHRRIDGWGSLAVGNIALTLHCGVPMESCSLSGYQECAWGNMDGICSDSSHAWHKWFMFHCCIGAC